MTCPFNAATIKIEDGSYVVKPTEIAADILNLGKLDYAFAGMSGAKIKAAELQSKLDDAYADACGE